MIFFLTFLFLFSISECGPVIPAKERQHNVSEPGDYPYLVEIVDEENGYYCAGTLISPKFVLTSSICFYLARSQNLYVWAGKQYEGYYNLDEKDLKRKIKSVEFHFRGKIETEDKYNILDTSSVFDIAIAELDEPFEMIPNVIGIIGFPEFLSEFHETDAMVLDWCDEDLDNLSKESPYPRSVKVDKAECYCGSTEDTVCWCKERGENTGSPLVIKGKLFGISMFNPKKIFHGITQYLKLYKIVDWIKKKLEIAQNIPSTDIDIPSTDIDIPSTDIPE